VDRAIVLEGAAAEVADELWVVLDAGNDAIDFGADDRSEVELVMFFVRIGKTARVKPPETNECCDMRPPLSVSGYRSVIAFRFGFDFWSTFFKPTLVGGVNIVIVVNF